MLTVYGRPLGTIEISVLDQTKQALFKHYSLDTINSYKNILNSLLKIKGTNAMLKKQQQNLRKQLWLSYISTKPLPAFLTFYVATASQPNPCHALGSASSAEMWDVYFNGKSCGDPEKEDWEWLAIS